MHTTFDNIRVITTSNDIMHCFVVPGLPVRADAIPGRLNFDFAVIKRNFEYNSGYVRPFCGPNSVSFDLG
eukprot:Awhi_evm2s248